ncbi:hypothetical protein VTO42DRAFT_6105 [Malbranchea cinnamomea]
MVERRKHCSTTRVRSTLDVMSAPPSAAEGRATDLDLAGPRPAVVRSARRGEGLRPSPGRDRTETELCHGQQSRETRSIHYIRSTTPTHHRPTTTTASCVTQGINTTTTTIARDPPPWVDPDPPSQNPKGYTAD